MEYPGDITPEQLLDVTAESLVTWVGVLDDGKGDRPESARIRPLSTQLALVQQRPLPRQMKIYSEVAAKYLPAVADVWRQRSEALGSVTILANALTTTGYFVRFLRSPAGDGLAALQAKRVANSVDEIGTMSVDDVAEVTQFLSTLFVLQGVRGVASEDRAVLLRHLAIWERRYQGRLAAETAGRCLGMLTDDPMMLMMTQGVKAMLESALDECGGPGCARRTQRDGSNLLQCARYCGVEHQKAAWPKHKPICFNATF
ncbi:hypothetical protein GGX14DRAFT_428941 [Mycena pura]|uniref:MYND-type domain-containing protein n=1 Tax=Mycena pura TaxID=153505 RepID=A0AAD6YL67_9AGAR|nr:hypothetical protein GGX14DRAFT_428941 [Mycena pura]